MSQISADSSQIIQGSKLMIWIGSQSIAMATNHTLTISTETNEISNKDLGAGAWASSSIKRFSWEASSDNMYTISAYRQLFSLMTNKTKVLVTFGISPSDALVAGDTSTGFADWTWTNPANSAAVGTDCTLQGYAYITSLDVQAPTDDNASFSITLSGCSELSMLD